MMDTVEVPHYFICPISLQIMRDPVTTPSGITYDRESIERWLFIDRNTTCPVTNQPLPEDSELITPNHTLRRLVQAWCALNSSSDGVERYPTPRAPVNRAGVAKLLDDLSATRLRAKTLKLMAVLASEHESNRRCMINAGVPSAMIQMIIEAKGCDDHQVEEALGVIHELRIPPDDLKPLVENNYDLIESLASILGGEQSSDSCNHDTRSKAILLLKSIFENASQKVLERLRVEFFRVVIKELRDRISTQLIKAALHILLFACPWGSNRTRIVEAGAVVELIELELAGQDKRTTEQTLNVLDHLCACADGRAQLVGHAAGIPVVSKRILRVSPAADDRAVGILSSVCKHSATNEVLQDLLAVGAVSKFCLLLQADCTNFVRERVRGILRLHSDVWKNSACLNECLLSSYP